VVLALALAVAVALSALHYWILVQYVYVFGVVLIFGVYSVVYQLTHAVKAYKAAKAMQPAVA
jgi:hypothetical protein